MSGRDYSGRLTATGPCVARPATGAATPSSALTAAICSRRLDSGASAPAAPARASCAAARAASAADQDSRQPRTHPAPRSRGMRETSLERTKAMTLGTATVDGTSPRPDDTDPAAVVGCDVRTVLLRCPAGI